jgi:inhibitor of cysteine peptidase
MGATACARENSKTVILTKKDNATIVALSQGDHLVLRLPVSMGTGYSWQLEKEEKVTLPLEGKPEQEPSAETKPGATETQIFRFAAKQKGEVSLKFRLIRPWEKEIQPLKTYSVTVRIH